MNSNPLVCLFHSLRSSIAIDFEIQLAILAAETLSTNKGMEIKFFAFFGNHRDPLDLAPSIESAESMLIPA
jgi:hypothetical protein